MWKIPGQGTLQKCLGLGLIVVANFIKIAKKVLLGYGGIQPPPPCTFEGSLNKCIIIFLLISNITVPNIEYYQKSYPAVSLFAIKYFPVEFNTRSFSTSFKVFPWLLSITICNFKCILLFLYNCTCSFVFMQYLLLWWNFFVSLESIGNPYAVSFHLCWKDN